MRVLWISNIVFPEAIQLLSGSGALRSSGGWMVGAANALSNQKDLELYVASVSPLVKTLTFVEGERIKYVIIPLGKGFEKYNKEYEAYWRIVKDKIKPNIVHIHGTEYSHGLAYVKACSNENVVVSIQGLTSVYSRYAIDGLNHSLIFRNITIRDLVRGGVKDNQKKLLRKGQFERELIQSVHHVIGRTSWDKSHTWAINPKAEYHFGNETLRPEFYSGCWVYEQCAPHTIFVSQAGSPIKGLHQLLAAMPLVLREYPDAKIRIAGVNIIASKTIKEKLYRTGYSKIIESLINKYDLKECISFTGPLNASEMKDEFLKSNVFVSPSTIENSPNSVGEAQLLGVPCISSYVGGVMDMIPNEECGLLYRFEEVEMLAYQICHIFKNSQIFDNSIMRMTALKRHDSENNAINTVEIYKQILNNTEK